MTMFENRYYFTLEDAELFIRKTEQKKWRPVAWVIGMLLLLEAVLLAALDQVYTPIFWLALAVGIFMICWYEFCFPRRRAVRRIRYAQKRIRRSQSQSVDTANDSGRSLSTGKDALDLKIESVVTVDDDGVTLTEGSYTKTWPYSDIKAFLDCGEYLVLMTKTGPLVYTGIPLRRNGFTKGDLSSCYAFLSGKQGTVRWLS